MLKKSLIALAIASVAGSAFAAEFKEDQKNYLSIQGAQSSEYVKVNQASATAAGDLVLTLDREYTENDLLTFEFAGAHLIKPEDIVTRAQLFSKDKFTGDGIDGDPYVKDNDDGVRVKIGTMVLGFQPSSTENTLVLRVTNLMFDQTGWYEGTVENAPVPNEQRTTRKAELKLEDVKLDVPAILANGTASVTFSSVQSNGTPQESTDEPYVLFEAKSQFELVAAETSVAFVDLLDGKDRKVFRLTDGTEDQPSAPKFKLDINDKAAGTPEIPYALPVTDAAATTTDKSVFTKVTFTLPGQFDFIGKPNAQGLITAGETGFTDSDISVQNSSTANTKLFADKLVAELDDATTLTTGDIVFTAPDANQNKVIPHQKFDNASVVFEYKDVEGNAQTFSQAGVYAGEWNLNGTLIHVPFMPFRAGFSPIVNVSNVAQTDGVITVVAYDQHNDWAQPETYTLDLKAKAQAQTNITPALRELGLSGDLALDILVDLPKDNIAVNALFFREGDRAVIQTIDRSWVEKD